LQLAWLRTVHALLAAHTARATSHAGCMTRGDGDGSDECCTQTVSESLIHWLFPVSWIEVVQCRFTVLEGTQCDTRNTDRAIVYKGRRKISSAQLNFWTDLQPAFSTLSVDTPTPGHFFLCNR
jgi:hypothetical protein